MSNTGILERRDLRKKPWVDRTDEHEILWYWQKNTCSLTQSICLYTKNRLFVFFLLAIEQVIQIVQATHYRSLITVTKMWHVFVLSWTDLVLSCVSAVIKKTILVHEKVNFLRQNSQMGSHTFSEVYNHQTMYSDLNIFKGITEHCLSYSSDNVQWS